MRIGSLSRRRRGSCDKHLPLQLLPARVRSSVSGLGRVPVLRLAFVTGQPMAFRSSPPVVRTFCGKCGTPLTFQHDETPTTIDVTTASLDFPERFAPTKEIWLEHKVAWEPVNEALPHFPRSSVEPRRPAT